MKNFLLVGFLFVASGVLAQPLSGPYPMGLPGSVVTTSNTPAQMALQPIRPYMGLVASGGRVPQNIYAGNTVYNGWIAYYTPTGFTNLICYFPNFYGNTETASGSPARISASICLQTNGPYQQMFFSGSPYTNIPSGGMACNDSNTLHAPPGIFWILTSYTNASGCILTPSCTGPFDCDTFGNTITDNTTNGVPPNLQSGVSQFKYGPIACVGLTTFPSVLVLGDSRDFGIGDQNIQISVQQSVSQFLGIDRLIAPLYGCANLSIQGDRFSYYTGGHYRMSFTNFATVVWTDLGINEGPAGNAANIFNLATNFYSLIPLPVIQETLSPETTSSDGWFTPGNQTPLSWDNYRTNFNTLLRHRLVPKLYGVCDVDAITESTVADGQNSGKWNIFAVTNFPGAVNLSLTNMTSDGIHGGYFGVLAASIGDPLKQQTPFIAAGTFAQTYAGTFNGNGAGVTNIQPFLIQTNFIISQFYTNTYGCTIQVMGSVVLTTASATVGSASCWLEAQASPLVGGWTNRSTAQTTATTLADTYTNTLSIFVPTNSAYCFTNFSTGSGNSVTVVGGQIKYP